MTAEQTGVVVPDAAAPRRRRWVAVAMAAALALLLLSLALPGAVAGGGSMVGAARPVGSTVYVGLDGSVRAPIELWWVRPVVATGGLEAEVFVCRDGGGIGVVDEADATELCGDLEPVGFGSRLDPQPPSGEAREALVVRLTATEPGRQIMCGVRVLYRSGLRPGFTRIAGPAAVITTPAPDPGADPAELDDAWDVAQAHC